METRYLTIKRATGYDFPNVEDIISRVNDGLAQLYGAPDGATVLYKTLEDALTEPNSDDGGFTNSARLDPDAPIMVFQITVGLPQENIK